MPIALLALLLSYALVASPLATQAPCDSWTSTGTLPGGILLSSVATYDPDGPGPVQPRLAVCGSFTRIGNAAVAKVADYDPTTGVWRQLGTGLDSLTILAALPNGGLVGAGLLSGLGGTTTVALWTGTNWQPLGQGFLNGTSPGSVIRIVQMPNGDLIAAGRFDSVGGVPVGNIALWNGSTWLPLGSGVIAMGSDGIRSLLPLPNGNLVVGGDFTIAGGQSASRIAVWDGSTWAPLGAGVSGPLLPLVRPPSVDALALLPNGDVVAAGWFNTAGGAAAASIALWNGTSWVQMPGVSGGLGVVYDLMVRPNGDLLVAGDFDTAGGVPVSNLASWNGSAWSALGLGTESRIFVIAPMPNGGVAAYGSRFTNSTGSFVGSLAHWDGTDWRTIGSSVGLEFFVHAVAPLANGQFVVGGTPLPGFTANLARWTGAAWAPIGTAGPIATGVSGVLALAALRNGDIVAGGYFASVGGVPANNLARWNGTTWAPLGPGINGIVSVIRELPNGDLVAGGLFTAAGGVPANNVAQWNGTNWTPLGLGTNGGLSALTVTANGGILAGGNFTTAGGLPANRIASWDGSSWAPLGTGLNGGVGAVTTLANGDVVAGGQFTIAGGVPANRMARWDGSAWSQMGPGVSSRPGFSAVVNQLVTLPSGDLLAGGAFDFVGLLVANSLVRWDGTSWLPLGDGANHVQALVALPNGDLVVGGTFHEAGGIPSSFAAIHHLCQPAYAAVGVGCAGTLGIPGNEVVTPARVGGVLSARFTNLPVHSMFVVVGWSNVSFVGGPLPFDLSSLGMAPGCFLRVSIDATAYLVGSNNTARWSLPIPNAPGFLGLSCFSQALVPDPNAAGLGMIASDAARVLIGN